MTDEEFCQRFDDMRRARAKERAVMRAIRFAKFAARIVAAIAWWTTRRRP